MQLKGMEDLAVFSAREVKRAAAEERDEYFSAEEFSLVVQFIKCIERFDHCDGAIKHTNRLISTAFS